MRTEDKVSDTPETDDAQWGTGKVTTDFARRLERERDEAREERDIALLEAEEISQELANARKQIEGLNNFANERYEEIQKVRKERDEAREVLRELYFAVQRKFAEWAPKNNINAASEEAAK